MPADAYPAPATVSAVIGTFDGYNGTYPLTVNWDSTGSTSGFYLYELEKKLSSETSWTSAGTFYGNSTTYSDMYYTPGATYNFRVRSAYGYAGNAFSTWTQTTLTVPGDPTNHGSLSFNNSIAASAVGEDGTLYVGGNFTSVTTPNGTYTRNYLAAISLTGTLLDWNPNAGGGTVKAIAVSGSTVYVGGTFTTIGGSAKNYLAAVDATTGALSSSFNPAPNVATSNSISAIAVDATGIYVGGIFSSIGGASRPKLAALNPTTGVALTTFVPLLNMSTEVKAIAVSGTTVYVGGNFRFSRWNNNLGAFTTSGAINSWNPNANGIVNSLLVSGNTVYAGGAFTTIGGVTANYFAGIDATSGSLRTDWTPNSGGAINALAMIGQNIYAGGAFTTMQGQTRNRLAGMPLYGGTSSSVLTWNPNANAAVSSLSALGQTIYAGGSFTTVGGLTRSYIAAIGVDGNITPGAEPDPRTVPPTISGVTISSPTTEGPFALGVAIDVTISTSQVINVTGNPTLPLMIGLTSRSGSYVSGNGSKSIVFRYTTLEGDFGTIATGSELNVNGGSIKNLLGFDLVLTISNTYLGKSVNAVTPQSPVITPGSQSFSSSFKVAVSDPGAGSNFLEFRFTTDFVSLLNCSTESAAVSISRDLTTTAVTIPLNTTSVRAIICSPVSTPSPETTVTYTYSASPSSTGIDTTAPSPGIFMASTNLTGSGYTLNWEPSSDAITSPQGLQYYVCSGATYASIATITACEWSTTAMAFANTTSLAVSGKAEGEFTYYNVIVKDAAGNKAIYNGKVQQTIPRQTLAFNDAVMAIDTDSTGTAYVGGSFTKVGAAAGGFLPLLKSNGNLAKSEAEILKVSGTVYASAMDSSGGVYIGGAFDGVGGILRNNLARFDKYGNLDLAWNPNANGAVSALAVSGSTVYVGGSFTSIGNITRKNLGAVNANDGNLLAWNPAPDSGIRAITLSNSKLYAGGNFSKIGVVSRSKLAAFEISDGSLTNWNPGANGDVYAMAVSASTMFLAGNFTSIGCASGCSNPQTTRAYAAAVGLNDGLVTSFNPNLNSTASSLATSATTVYVGGSFSTTNSVERRGLAAFTISTNALLTTFDAGLQGLSGGGSYTNVTALAFSGTKIFAGGVIGYAGAQVTPAKIVVLDENTGALQAMTFPDVFTDRCNNSCTVSTISVSDTTIYAGGNFRVVNSVARNCLAAINPNGSLSTSWIPTISNGTSGIQVSTIKVSSPSQGSNIYIGGYFVTVNGSTRNNAAALDSAGNLLTWNPNAGAGVQTLAIRGTTIYLGGDFTSIGSATRNYAAAVDSTNGTVLSWNPNPSMANSFGGPYIAPTADNVYLGGSFWYINGTQKMYLGAVSTANGSLNSWAPGPNTSIMALAADETNSLLYVGGQFSTMSGGVSRKGFAAFSTSDNTLVDWTPNFGSVLTYALLVSGSNLYVFGQNGSNLKLSRINTTTRVVDTAWGSSFNGQAPVLAVFGDKIYVGGTFTSVKNTAVYNFSILPTQ